MRTRQTGQASLPVAAQKHPRLSLQRHARRTRFFFVLSFFLVLLSACANPLGAAATPVAPTATVPVLLSPTPTPFPTPGADPLQAAKEKVLSIMAGMSLEQKLGQLIVVEYLGNSYQDSGLQYMIQQQYIGGVLYQYVNHNFNAPEDTIAGMAAFSKQAQQDSKIPLLLGTDQEGGQVNRLETFHGALPSAAEMAATGKPQYALDQGTQAAKWMLQLGINTDLAPVVDVHTVNPPILQDRMFGSTPAIVETYAGAFIDGLQQNGVIGTLKHFPGLGAVTSDPHAGLPTVNRSLVDLESIDLAPYKVMIAKNNPAMIMDTDVLMPAIDQNLPAELSPKAVTGMLRGYLGYNGVVITDGLYMDGISEHWSLSQAAVLSIVAGDDLVEGPYTTSQVAGVVTALKQAVASGQLTEARIDQSVERILLMKVQYGLIK